MTEATGYPRELLRNKSDLTKRIICGVCNLILRDVVQHECGHRFCSSCGKTLMSDPQPQFCPVCPVGSHEAPIRIIYPDFAGRKEIRLLKVKCPKFNCPFEGHLFEYTTNHQDACPHAKVPCPACGKQMKRVDLENHCLRDCTERTVTCRWCNTEMMHTNMKQHNGVCPKLEILCELCKKSKLPREEIKLHQDPENGDCPRRKRCCKFRMVGCEFKLPQEQMSGHLENNLQEHLNLLMEDYVSMKRQLEQAKTELKKYESMDQTDCGKSKSAQLDLEMDEIYQKVLKKLEINGDVKKPKHNVEVDYFKSVDINSDDGGAKNGARKKVINANQAGILKEGVIKEESVARASEITELKTVVQHHSQQIKSLQQNQSVLMKNNGVFHDVIDVFATEMDNTRQQTVKALQEVEQLKAVDQAISGEDMALTEQFLQIQCLENTTYSGILVWKLPNFSQKRRDAIGSKHPALNSPYLDSRFDCLFKVILFPNGYGSETGRHVSASIVFPSYNSSQTFPARVRFVLFDRNHRKSVAWYTPGRPQVCTRSQTGSMTLLVLPGCLRLLPVSSVPMYLDLDGALTIEVHLDF